MLNCCDPKDGFYFAKFDIRLISQAPEMSSLTNFMGLPNG